MDEVKQILVENYVRDLQKKDIDPFFRAKLLGELMSDTGMTMRGFAKEYGIHHNTVEDWMLFDRITLSEYNTLKAKGLNHTDIYRVLRDNRTKDIDWDEQIKNRMELKETKQQLAEAKATDNPKKNYIDLKLITAKKDFDNIRCQLNKYQLTGETKAKVKELIDSLNRLLMYMERK